MNNEVEENVNNSGERTTAANTGDGAIRFALFVRSSTSSSASLHLFLLPHGVRTSFYRSNFEARLCFEPTQSQHNNAFLCVLKKDYFHASDSNPRERLFMLLTSDPLRSANLSTTNRCSPCLSNITGVVGKTIQHHSVLQLSLDSFPARSCRISSNASQRQIKLSPERTIV